MHEYLVDPVAPLEWILDLYFLDLASPCNCLLATIVSAKLCDCQAASGCNGPVIDDFVRRVLVDVAAILSL